ncbi:four helix bundle protein [Desulfobulbus sp. AH-315-M07]|nr:four helix bundle protein [Desulfobulbus sp. AH-315-M07]
MKLIRCRCRSTDIPRDRFGLPVPSTSGLADSQSPPHTQTRILYVFRWKALDSCGNDEGIPNDHPFNKRLDPVTTGTGNSNAIAQRTTQRQQKGDDIAERLLDLAAEAIKLLPELVNAPSAKNLAKQLERCGPAGGANYEEARGAESPADFVHKVRVSLKEVRETRYWLRLLHRADLIDNPRRLDPLIDEAGQLIAILTASANTARRKLR